MKNFLHSSVCLLRHAQMLTRVKDFFLKFAVLKEARRELWVIYALKFLESYAYFSMSMNFVLYLSSERFSYSDLEAGTYFGLWGVLINVYGIITGPLIDIVGVKWAMLLGSFLSLIGRLMFAFATDRWHLVVSTCLLMPLGMSMGIPVMTIGIKQCTSTKNMSLAFGLFYSMMNVGAVASGRITDFLNDLFQQGVEVGGVKYAPLSMIFLTSTISTLFYFLLVLFAYRPSGSQKIMGDSFRLSYLLPTTWFYWCLFGCGGPKVDDEIHLVADDDDEEKEEKSPTCSRICTVLKDKIFWKLMLFSTLITGVNLIYRHMDATFPKYVLRDIGADVKYGTLYLINPLMIIFLVPVSQAVFASYDPYKCILVGSAITGISVFWMLFDGKYWSAVFFIVTLSIGESIYSPRVYEYVMMLAPAGQEGLYSMMSSTPMFSAALLTGSLSGYLLENYCPASGKRRCNIMWLIIGAISLISPLFLALCKKYIHGDDVRERISNYENQDVEMDNVKTPPKKHWTLSKKTPENEDAALRNEN